MADVTHIRSLMESGDPKAAELLLPLVYDELRKLAAAKLAHEKPGQTLQATALVHEAYLRLVPPLDLTGPEKQVDSGISSYQKVGTYDSRGHFFAAAAEAMRRILVENARRKSSLKRGGKLGRIDLTQVGGNEEPWTFDPEPEDFLALEDALVKLDREDSHVAALARLRLYTGLTVEEAAEALGVSRTTAFRNWTYARAFLQAEVQAK